MRASIVVTAVGLALLAGCGTPDGDTVSVARRAGPAASASGAAASPAPTLDRAALVTRSRAAMVKPDAYKGFGVPATVEKQQYDNDEATSQICGLSVIGESNLTHVSNFISWDGPDIYVLHFTHGYTKLTGKEVVEAVRRNASNCTTWTERYTDGDIKYTFLETYDLGGVVAGADASYARCDNLKFVSGDDTIYCDAFIAKGPLLTRLSVTFGSVQETKAKLNQMLPTAVAALVAA
ncbi:hypothetical protein Val02_07670 [Virgisporangium aliadipatigenens]|uniref:Lipoprotein n=1 Tax=Virgisporangium aliadipatigenens TaxID=741659 RepID=A0A8J3YH68_9ACTN|nr:hypothetical protein [Virgisporangium aliadipatigenens]GIJ43881.1 hypothetical protein Val02_07670 [Virgisporangium aliadipatigenens]